MIRSSTRVETREQDDGRPVGVEPHPAQQVEARRAGQPDVEHDGVGSRLAPEAFALARVARRRCACTPSASR